MATVEEKDDVPLIIRFILPKGKTETTCSEDLGYAFDQAQDHGLEPTWSDEQDCLSINPGKTDVFVIDPFEGDGFLHLSQFKCTVIGPRCLLTCLNKNTPVPNLPYPMYTVAMEGMVVTSTGFQGKEDKKELQTKIERMGGLYSNNFHDGVTHLVAKVVRSPKYDVAVSKEIPIMTNEWVTQVWERGKHDNIHATNPTFTRYKCPALMGLTLTVSQMGKKDKEILKKSIESHGGTYTGQLDMEHTEILIISKPEGDKYKYAKKWKIPCISSDWVFDSIEKGYCLKTEGYRVDSARGSTSTPTKDGLNVPTLQDVSSCSTILAGPDESITKKINETMNNTTINPSNNNSTFSRHCDIERPSKSADTLLKTIDAERLKRAGQFLAQPECRIFLSGFTEHQLEHLKRCIKSSGAKIMNQLAQSVTHIIVKQTLRTDHKRLIEDLQLNPYIVGLEWIIESMNMGMAVSESDFLVSRNKSIEQNSVRNHSIDKTMRPTQGNRNHASDGSINSIDDEKTLVHDDELEEDIISQYKTKTIDNDNRKIEKLNFKTPKSTKSSSATAFETPLGIVNSKERIRPKPLDFTLTPSDDPSPFRMPPESQPSPANLKRKRDDNDQCTTPFILRNVKTPETPYGAFMGKNPSKNTRKFWKLQCEEMGRFEFSKEQRAELDAKKEKVSQYVKERECEREASKMIKEYDEYFKRALDPEKTKAMHANTFKRCGVPLLEPGGKTFDELMEEKMQKQGLSWKRPKRPKDDIDEASVAESKIKSNENSRVYPNGESNYDSEPTANLNASLAKFDELAAMQEKSTRSPQLQNLDESSKTSKRRSSMKMTLSSLDNESERLLIPDLAKENGEKLENQRETPILWINPKEQEERKNLTAKLAIDTQGIRTDDFSKSNKTFDTMDLPENLTEELNEEKDAASCTSNSKFGNLENDADSDKENEQCKDSETLNTNHKYFMTSGIGPDVQEEFYSFLEKIGVSFATTSICEPSATHVIAQKISRSEKMLGSIASGKWLLHPSYMVDSLKAGKLLPEDKYEWGSTKNDLINDLSSDQEVKLAKASCRHRIRRQNGLDPVFSGFKAIIHTNEQRKSSFKKLLEFGGGKVINSEKHVRPPYSDPKDATHCIAEPKKLPKQSIDFMALANKGVPVVSPLYINEFLASDPSPCVDNYLIEEFVPFWKKKNF